MVSTSKIGLALTASFIIFALSGCTMEQQEIDRQLHYNAVEKQITINGNISDWEAIDKNIVQGAKHLWTDQDLTQKKWQGNDDHSFSWRAAWYKNKFYFLIEVTDDNPQPCTREFSWINDCVEIQFDPKNLEGERITGVTVDTPIQERIGKKINGYEMHFLPCFPPRVYLDDTRAVYRLENDQNEMFFSQWDGEIETKLTDNGYLLEIGLSVPGLKLKPGMIVGLDVAVGDDDGNERKSLMLWTGKQVAFWITMDYYGKMKLVK